LRPTLFPYTTLFRSVLRQTRGGVAERQLRIRTDVPARDRPVAEVRREGVASVRGHDGPADLAATAARGAGLGLELPVADPVRRRSEEHTSELQSRSD